MSRGEAQDAFLVTLHRFVEWKKVAHFGVEFDGANIFLDLER